MHCSHRSVGGDPSHHGLMTVERSVQRSGDACTDRHHPAAERVGVARFDEEVCVRVLERVVDEAKVAARADSSEAMLEPVHERDGSQGRKPRTELHGHVGREASGEALPAAMRNARRA